MNLNLFKHFLLAILKTFDLGKKKKSVQLIFVN